MFKITPEAISEDINLKLLVPPPPLNFLDPPLCMVEYIAHGCIRCVAQFELYNIVHATNDTVNSCAWLVRYSNLSIYTAQIIL